MSQKDVGVAGTPEKKVRTKKEYSAEFIQKTVCDYYRSGTSLAAFCKTSNLPYTTVRDWVEKFTDKYPVMASKEVSKDEQTRALEEENARLRKELAAMTKERDTAAYRAHAWETMVDVAEEMFQIPIKKNLAPNCKSPLNRFLHDDSKRYLQGIWRNETGVLQARFVAVANSFVAGTDSD